MRSATVPRWLLVVLATAGLCGCTSAKLPNPAANGIVVTVAQESITADEGTITASVQVLNDGVALLQQTPTVSLTGADSATLAVLTSPTSGVATATFTGVTVAGSVTVTATVGKLSASAAVTVLPGNPVSVTVTPGLASVVADTGVEPFTTGSKDKFGNVVPDAPVEVTTNAPGGQVSGLAVSGLHTAGSWLLTAGVAGFPAVVGSAGFAVTAGAPALVKSSVTETTIQAGTTNTLNCAETDQFGNPISGATFTGSVSAPGVVGGATPAFSLTGLVPGLFNATCTDAALHSSASFDVVDTIAPTSTLTLVSATGPNGITSDGHYASGTTLTFQVAGTKNVGGRIASEQISASGPVVLIGSSVHAEPSGSGTSASFNFQMVVNSPTGTLIDFDSIVVQGQVTDEAGNSALSTQTSLLTVDQGAGIAVANGVTLREFFVFSSPISTAGVNTPIALATSAGSVYVTATTSAPGFLANDAIYRVPSAGTAFTTVVGSLNPTAVNASQNLVVVTAGYGSPASSRTFETVNGGAAIAAVSTDAAISLFPTVAGNAVSGLVYGTFGGTTTMWDVDVDGLINQYSPTGTRSVLFTNTAGVIAPAAPMNVAIGSSGGAPTFIVSAGGGQLYQIDASGTATQINFSTTATALAVDGADRIALGTPNASGGGFGLLLYSPTGTFQQSATSGLTNVIGLAATGTTVFVLDNESTVDHHWRIYKVTGY